MQTLDGADLTRLYRAIKTVLKQMADRGGRDTETDLFGRSGGYPTVMSKSNLGEPCPVCGVTIVKQTYLGGSVYFCPGCQKL